MTSRSKPSSLAPKRAVIYARISQTQKVDKVADQTSQCRDLAAKYGYDVVAVFSDDGISASRKADGTVLDRVGFDGLLEFLDGGGADIVLATEEARFDRDGQAKRELEFVCQTNGLTWHTIRDGHVDPGTDAGELMSGIRVLMDRQESRRSAARRKAANAMLIAKGMPSGGKRPYGFESDLITVRESEAKWVRFMYAEVLKGTSLYMIRKALNDGGARTTGGKLFSATLLKDTLSRPRNCGRLVALGVLQEKSLINQIVEPAVFDEAMGMLSAIRADGKTSGPKPELNWLSSMILCASCGAPMISKLGAQGTHRYYMCNRKASGMDSNVNRKHVIVRADQVEALVSLRMYGELLSRFSAPPTEVDGTALAQVHSEIAANAAERTNLTEMYLLPGVDKKLIASKLATLATADNALNVKRVQLLAKGAQGGELAILLAELQDGDLEPAEEPTERFSAIWTALPSERRRAVVAGSFHIVVGKGKGLNRVRFIPV